MKKGYQFTLRELAQSCGFV